MNIAPMTMTTVLFLALLQIPGHDTVPATGPAARERHETLPRETEAVGDRIERLRDELRALGRAHHKLPAAERKAREAELAQALDELTARVRALRGGLEKR